MPFDLLESEKKALSELEARYAELINRIEDTLESIHPYPHAELQGIESEFPAEQRPEDDLASWETVSNKYNDRLDQWDAAGSEEWHKLREELFDIEEKARKDTETLYKLAEDRHFSSLKGDQAVFADAQDQALAVLERMFSFVNRPGLISSRYASETKIRGQKLLSAKVMREHLKNVVRRHRDLLSPAYKKKLDTFIADILEQSSLVDTPAAVNTRYPMSFLTPTDKLSHNAFANELTDVDAELTMGRRGSKKKITTMASIDFEKLNGTVEIRGRKELTAYDREVHDAIVTLYVEGDNEFITPQMIYQVMTGNQDAYLEKKQAEAISDSITKCMYSRIIIDASEEAKAYGFDGYKYDGSLISGERATATLNGNTLECLRILRPPVLYEYADKKNQIGRFDINLLNTPINKTEEIITLQGYLSRRILSMKGSSSLSRTIVYDTVYKQLKVTASSDGALRKKKAKIRDQIKIALSDWKKKGFIKGYQETKQGSSIYSITIEL